jgi:hypothetical protein
LIGFIDDHRVVRGVELICRVLPIAPSTYHTCLAVRADPSAQFMENNGGSRVGNTEMALRPLSVIARQSPVGQWMQASPAGLQVDWFNNRRLLEHIGNIPPAEAEDAFYASLNTLDMVA